MPPLFWQILGIGTNINILAGGDHFQLWLYELWERDLDHGLELNNIYLAADDYNQGYTLSVSDN